MVGRRSEKLLGAFSTFTVLFLPLYNQFESLRVFCPFWQGFDVFRLCGKIFRYKVYVGTSAQWIYDMTLTYALASNETHATLYLSGAIVGTLSRPFETVTFQKAVPNGDKWRVSNRNGETVLATFLRPSKVAISRALGL